MDQKKFDIKYKVRADYEHFLWCFFEGGAKTVYMPLLIADYEGGRLFGNKGKPESIGSRT